MPSCLGLYIENNLIKYAKVDKDHNVIKVEAFGIKFYDKLGDAIKQIIEETYSFKTPISINLSQETYNYFYMFSLLNQRDMPKAIQTEFEAECFDKGINEKTLESRYALVNSFEDKEKIKVIHISTSKSDIASKTQQFSEYKLTTISPLSLDIVNIVSTKQKENIAIVNIENKTTVTTIIDEKIYDINTIEEGSYQVLEEIRLKENSYAKAYEICKGTTIYTAEGEELQTEENLYLENIMPTLYKIVNEVKNIVEGNLNKIEKIYITGTLSVINNIDLYFQEYIKDAQCEILKPYFINELSNIINIKDYMEVNSAIALALQGLGEGLKNMNFKKSSFVDNLPEWTKIEIGGSGKKLKESSPSKFNFSFKFDLKEKLDKIETMLLRGTTGLLAIILIYTVFSVFLNTQFQNKENEIKVVEEQTTAQLKSIDSDISKINEKTNQYIKSRENLEQISDQLAESVKTKNSIPTLLHQLMNAIPVNVQITSVENTSSKKVIIEAQSKTYDPLGYFVVKIRVDEILTNVVSTSGKKEGDFVKITIEGELS